MDYSNAEETIESILSANPGFPGLQKVVDALYEGFEKYSWVGIYLLKEGILLLGPWRGAQATQHTSIPLGTGVCGSAAKTGKTELVGDVSKDARYLSCFLSTRSEIVVPIKRGTQVLGEIDIDSDQLAAFERHDVVFLEKVADMLQRHI
ncbi:MAG: GAF domain-containing protein [Candidatus Thermoplasmatota archaeon]|nr:GAF domain-containing protein [Candidatus Thermoplasmatota archaeon]